MAVPCFAAPGMKVSWVDERVMECLVDSVPRFEHELRFALLLRTLTYFLTSSFFSTDIVA